MTQRTLFGPSLAEARADYFDKVDKGATCPLCTKRGQRYHRKLNSGMARDLIRIYRKHGLKSWEWHEVWHAPRRKKNKAGNEFSKLRFWGLVIKDERLKRWCITEKGEQFILNRLSVPRYAWILHNQLDRFMGGPTDIVLALGDHFDYEELMRG